jgi:hypothetical protein
MRPYFDGISWQLSSSNDSFQKSGRHFYFQNGKQIVWFVGNSPQEAVHVIGRNEEYSFVLVENKAKNQLIIHSLDIYAEGGEPRTPQSFLFVASGAMYGFHFLPALESNLSDMRFVVNALRFEPPRIAASGAFQYRFKIEQEKLGECLRDVNSIQHSGVESLIRNARNIGFKKGEFDVDPETLLPLRFQAEFEFLREPVTEKIIAASNAAGQRRPDGTEFPLSLAEPEGELILEKQGMVCRWKYKEYKGNPVVAEFACEKLSEDVTSAVAAEFRVSDISFEVPIPANVFTLTPFGFPEPGFHPQAPQETSRRSIWPKILAIAACFVGLFVLSKWRCGFSSSAKGIKFKT